MQLVGPTRTAPGQISERGTLRIEGVSKIYGEDGEALPALDPISLDIPANSFVSLLGPSGCGKSTLLKLIAGIEMPSGGSIRCQAREIRGVNTEVAYVPQGRGLFPWMTLVRNVEFPLKLAGVP